MMFRFSLLLVMCVSLAGTERLLGQESAPSKPDGSGVRMHFVDVDNDGIPDLYAARAHDQDRLLRGRGDGTFEDRTDSSGLKGLAGTRLALWNDFDQDELQDLLVVIEDGRCRLYRNTGHFAFDDVTRVAGLLEVSGLVTAEWLDFDADGRLDLHGVTPQGDLLYRNLDLQTFGKVSLGLPDPIRTAPAPTTPVPAPVAPVDPNDEESSAGSGQPPWGQDPEQPRRERVMGGSATPTTQGTEAFAGSLEAYFLNDNSPSSVGVGVPEVEGGPDTGPNDIVDGTVTSSDIQDGSLGSADIQDNSLTSSDIQNGSLTGSDIQDGSLTFADIQDNSLTSADILDGTLTSSDIQNGSLTGVDIQDGSLFGNVIHDNSLSSADIEDHSLTGIDIADGSLTGADVADGSLAPADVSGVAATLNGDQVFNDDLRVQGRFLVDTGLPIRFDKTPWIQGATRYDTGIPSGDYAVFVGSFMTSVGDINENGSGYILRCYTYESGGTWWVMADFRSHNTDEAWQVGLVRVSTKICSNYNWFLP